MTPPGGGGSAGARTSGGTVARWRIVALTSALLLITAPRWLPLPPPLPADPPTDLAAPVPNDDLTVPDSATREHSTFALRFYHMHEYGTGDGFIPGSAYQSPEERKPLQTPGFMVTVPLQ